MSEQKMTRPEALRRALPILIVTLIGAVVIGLLAVRSVRILDTTGPESTNLSLLAPVCGGEGYPAADVFDRQTAGHPAVIVRETDGEWTLDPDVVPAEFRPETIGDVQLILCVSAPESVSTPLCDAAEVVLMEQVAVRLASAQTGATVDEDVLLPAGVEGECIVNGGPAVVTDADLWAWVRPYVTGGLE